MPEGCVAALCNNVNDPENNISHSVFIVGSWTYVTGISLVAILSTLFLWSAAGVDCKKKKILNFVKIRKKMRFIQIEKIFRRSSLGEM